MTACHKIAKDTIKRDHGVGSSDHFSALKIWMFENKFVSLPSHLKTIEPMARPIRKKSGTGIYHVMLRGINRQDIFEDEEDYRQMTSILRGLTDRYDEQGLRLPPLCIWKEYVTDSRTAPVCSTKPVFSRIPREDLMELVNSPVEEYGQILDIDTDNTKPVSDSDVKAFLLKSKGIANPLIIQSLEKTRRNEMLISALSIGAGIRQISRLTGVSFGVIQKLQK